MGRFIYVFNEEDRDALLALDYKLIYSDEHRKAYMFENNEELQFSLGIKAVFSDVINL